MSGLWTLLPPTGFFDNTNSKKQSDLVERTRSPTFKEPDMRRRTFDTILTSGGVVVAIILVVAGALLMWGHDFANSNVRSQLAEQQITFPPKAVFANPPAGSTEITPAMKQYLYK